jgi:hypothetical protein
MVEDEAAGFFDVEECLARLSGLGDQLEAFPRLWILKSSVRIWNWLWPIQTEAKVDVRRLIRY